MDEVYFKKIVTTVILAVLIVLSFLLLRPILLSIIFGLVLAFVFSPVYSFIYGKTGYKNISASIIIIALLSMIVLPISFLIPLIINQSTNIYFAYQQINVESIIKGVFPSLISMPGFAEIITSSLDNFLTKTLNSIGKSFTIDNFMNIFLQLVVVFFTFFFALRDKIKLVSYIKSLLPFSKDIEDKLFKYSSDITSSVLYGQVVVGMIQGLIVGIGFFMFRVPNALFLTFLATLAGIFPIIGTTIIWLPVAIYLFLAGNTFAALGVTIFGIVSISVDNFIRPIIVSKRTRMPSSLIIIGMIGGLFLFGVLGFILGPLILAYLLIILELYRSKEAPRIFLQNPHED